MSRASELLELCEALKPGQFLALIKKPNGIWQLTISTNPEAYINTIVSKSKNYPSSYRPEAEFFTRDELIRDKNIKLINVWNEQIKTKTGLSRIEKKNYYISDKDLVKPLTTKYDSEEEYREIEREYYKNKYAPKDSLSDYYKDLVDMERNPTDNMANRIIELINNLEDSGITPSSEEYNNYVDMMDRANDLLKDSKPNAKQAAKKPVRKIYSTVQGSLFDK